MLKQELKKKEIAREKSDDFAQKNLLSYIYEKKENPAIENRKRNDQVVGAISSKFGSPAKMKQDLECKENEVLKRDEMKMAH